MVEEPALDLGLETGDYTGLDFDFNFDDVSTTTEKNIPSELRSTVPASKVKTVKKVKSKDGIKPPRRAKMPRASNSAVTALSLAAAQPKVNMSRRRPYDNVIVAFPSFDKCDSLIYFPSTFTRHLNNGDMPSLWKLFESHMDRKCIIIMADCYSLKDHLLPPQLFFKTYEMLNELQPDRIMCVDATKVEGNRINASIHMKLTDTRFIYDSVFRNSMVPELRTKVPADRQVCLHHKIDTMNQPKEVLSRYRALVESDVDLLLYIHLFMDITFDDTTRKITSMRLHGDVTSMHEVNCNPAVGSL